MKTTVWMVFHADIDDDRYVRGIFATKGLADQVVTLDETTVYPANLTFGERIGVRHHNEWCCSVDEMVVDTKLPEPFVLNPQKPYDGPGLIPVALFPSIMELQVRAFPLFDTLMARRIGTVESVTKDEKGITVTAELDRPK